MQKSFDKLKNISVSVLLLSIILVLMRTALLIFGFDFESAFFTNDALAYSLYALLIIICVVSYIMPRDISPVSIVAPKNLITDICISLAAVIFICFAVIYTSKNLNWFESPERNPLKTASYVLCLPTSVLSAVYYLTRLFSKKEKSAAISLLAVCPVIFLSALLLERFATVSASASSLSHFPDIISLLVLAFFILTEGKTFIPTNRTSAIIPCNFITFTALAFSALPDFITFITGRNVLNFESIVFMILKAVFALYVCTTTTLMAHDMKEKK